MILVSQPIIHELDNVLRRPHLDRYVHENARVTSSTLVLATILLLRDQQ